MKDDILIFEALQGFASAVTEKMTQIISGEPEDQLRTPFDDFMSSAGSILGWELVLYRRGALTKSSGET